MNKDEFFTRDLHFAAFLKLNGLELVRLERHESEFRDRNPVYFVFSNKEKCEHLENIFWSGEGDEIVGNIKAYVDTVRSLRARTAFVNNVVNQNESSKTI
jgi:hypothetical protein